MRLLHGFFIENRLNFLRSLFSMYDIDSILEESNTHLVFLNNNSN